MSLISLKKLKIGSLKDKLLMFSGRLENRENHLLVLLVWFLNSCTYSSSTLIRIKTMCLHHEGILPHRLDGKQ